MKLSELLSKLNEVPNPENVEVIIECNGFCPVVHVDHNNIGYQPITGTNRGNVGYTSLNDSLRLAGYTDNDILQGNSIPCILLTPIIE